MRTTMRGRRHARTISLLFLTFSVVCPAQEAGHDTLSPSAREVAHLIGVEPLLGSLAALSSGKDPGATGMTLEELSLRQQITEAVMAAVLDVDSAMDQIDSERAQIVELQSILLARRQRAIGTTNLATLALSTGLGAVSGVLQFSDTTKGVGNAIGFAAGGISTLLSFRSFRQQHSEGRPAWVLPSMLTPFFGEPVESSDYPANIWAYLSSAPEGSQTSRREQLLSAWLMAERFPAADSPKFQARIALLTSADATDKQLNMDLLSERAAMLADVRDELAAMKRVLGEIMRHIRVSR